MKKKNVSQLVRFDNSLKEMRSNFLKRRKRMQQDSNLYANFFINDFHYRCELNKSRHNNTSSIVPKTLTILKVLHRFLPQALCPCSVIVSTGIHFIGIFFYKRVLYWIQSNFCCRISFIETSVHLSAQKISQ